VRAPDEPASGSAPPGAPAPGAPDVDPAGLGPRVTAVFTAAEQAADHILRMAREEVEDLRRSAEAEIDSFRAQRRSEAEREAREIVDGARNEAEAIRREAREVARTIEGAARRREQWINEGIRLMVERVEWGRRGLDEVLTRLADLAVRPLPEVDESGRTVLPDEPPEPAERPASPRTVAEELRPAAAFAGPETESAAEDEAEREADVDRYGDAER
jgi:vacuolar-type H+-ATPase subunit H